MISNILLNIYNNEFCADYFKTKYTSWSTTKPKKKDYLYFNVYKDEVVIGTRLSAFQLACLPMIAPLFSHDYTLDGFLTSPDLEEKLINKAKSKGYFVACLFNEEQFATDFRRWLDEKSEKRMMITQQVCGLFFQLLEPDIILECVEESKNRAPKIEKNYFECYAFDLFTQLVSRLN